MPAKRAAFIRRELNREEIVWAEEGNEMHLYLHNQYNQVGLAPGLVDYVKAQCEKD